MSSFEISFFENFSNFKFHRNIYIAYSGGIDSSVLLYLCSKFFDRNNFIVKALHVNHGYSNAAFSWAMFCKGMCDEYKIPILIVSSKDVKKKNIEQEFRFVRFNSFLNLVLKNSTLLLAHNGDDFLETMFLRLFRGASFFSIFGIQYTNKLGKLNILRPLVNFSKNDITKFAFFKSIRHVTDFSNFDSKFSRNYVRCKILPLITIKWPNFNRVIFRAFTLSNSFYFYFYFRLLYFFRSNGFNLDFLDINYLFLLPYFLRCEVVKFWIKVNNFRTPSYCHFKELDKFLRTFNKKSGFIFVKEYILRRNNDYLFIEPVLRTTKFRAVSVHLNFFSVGYLQAFALNNCLKIDSSFFLLKGFFFVKCLKCYFFVLGFFYHKKFLKNFFLFKSLY